MGVSGVVLSYSIDEGQTWIDTAMPSSSANTYSGEISGFEEGKHIQYKILAYDNNGNSAVEDNSGSYYIYTVIPELQNFLFVMLFISAALAIILILMRKRKGNDTVQEDKQETNSSTL